MPKHQVLSSQVDYQCPWFTIQKEEIRYPNNYQNTFYILRRPNSFIGIIAIENNQLIILKQWRPTIKDYHWEIPMGGMNDNETPLIAAQREFLEETGYKADAWQEIGQFYVGAGHSDQIGIFFLATNLIKVTGKAEDNPSEMIEVNQFSLQKIDKMIKSGEIKDGPTLAALHLYQSQFIK